MFESAAEPFEMQRLGIVMRADPDDPWEAWGVLNPGGVRGPDDEYYLFPRLVAEGNYSRIGRGRVIFNQQGDPVDVERLGLALEPRESYERSQLGGGVEDPRVTYIPAMGSYVMTYTAYVPNMPRIALAISTDLVHWERLGPLHFSSGPGEIDLNEIANKDALLFPELVRDPNGQPSIALIHRPSFSLANSPALRSRPEVIWISYSPVVGDRIEVSNLMEMHEHRVLMTPQADWEHIKIGGGAPPVRLPYGWLMLYHGVSLQSSMYGQQLVYSAGAAVLDLTDPSRVLYQSPRPILKPELPHETQGIVPNVVFPTATDLRSDGRLDVYYGAADAVIGAARLTVPATLPEQTTVSRVGEVASATVKSDS
ncbi:MAG: glycosidase [Chloroflexi bacterium]|nr:glycosidase [Chloroflexota bacterium]